MNVSPLTIRRLRNFRANKRGYYSALAFSVLVLISIFAEFIANDKPILVVFKSQIHFPVLEKIPETYFKKLKDKKYYPELNAGDCIFHHCEVIHGSKKNISNLDRIGLVISYKGLSAKINKKKLLNYKSLVKKNLLSLKRK